MNEHWKAGQVALVPGTPQVDKFPREIDAAAGSFIAVALDELFGVLQGLELMTVSKAG